MKYAIAGSIAEEAFTAIRTVAAFGLEKLEILRCDVKLIVKIVDYL